jgi:chemotaxis protein CheX
MQFSSEEIFQLVQYIWSMTLEIEVEPSNETLPNEMVEGLFTGCVHIAGNWNGTMTLRCPEDLARLASSIMLGADHGDVTTDDMLDTMGELTNMIVGNLKGLIPGACQVSVPIVTHGSSGQLFVPESQLLYRVALESEGHSFEVMLLEGKEATQEGGPSGAVRSLGASER